MKLGMSLAGAAVGAIADGTNGAATGATAAYAGVTNNFLKHEEAEKLAAAQRKLNQCGGDTACKEGAQAEIDYWQREDERRDR